MSQRSSLIETGIDRVRTTVETATKEIRRVQKRVESQRKTIEKRVASQRKAFEKRAQAQLDRVVSQVRDSAIAKNAEALRAEATRRLEAGVETVLSVLPIASRSELERVDKKLSQISRKLKDLEKGSSAAA
jgi:hypothetical protein